MDLTYCISQQLITMNSCQTTDPVSKLLLRILHTKLVMRSNPYYDLYKQHKQSLLIHMVTTHLSDTHSHK